MPSFQINDAEWAALVEEPGDVFLLYCSIRRYMDYATGIAGIRRRISEQMLREVLYVAPTRGRHEAGSPSRQRVRSVIDRLVTLDAIRPIGPMVYQLPLASRDGLSESSATNQQPDQQPDQQPEDEQPEPNKDGASSDEQGASATGSETGDTPISNLPPVSGFLPSSRHRAHEPPDRFPMHDDWTPTSTGWKATALRNGLGAAVVSNELLMEFRSYWINREDKYQSQGQWEHELAQKIIRETRYAQANGRSPAGSQRTGSRRPLSAPDRVRKAIDQQRAERAKAGRASAHGASGEAMGDHGGDLRPPLDVEFWREPQT